MSAFTLWGKDGDDHYLLDFSEGKWGFTSQMAIIEKYCELYAVDKIIIEKRATGTAMIDYLRERVRSNIVGFEPKFSTKVDRVDSVEPYFTGGHIFIPDEKMKPKVETMYLNQMLAFPRGGQDGLVDTTSQYLMDDRQAKGGKIITKAEDLEYYRIINAAIRRRN
jgi:predicted phage terminase large subunit-like protein